MSDENQEVEHVGYGEKLGDSCAGMCFGIVLFFGALGTSAWNEYRNVATMKTINAAKEEFKLGNCNSINPEFEGELVHIACPVSNLDVLGNLDPVLLGIPETERTGISLESYMQVYAWDEKATTETKDNKVGGGSTKTTTYTYSRNWQTYTPDDVTSFFNSGATCQTQNGGNLCVNWNPSQVEPWWTASTASLGTKVIDYSNAPMAGQYVIPQDQLSHLGTPKTLIPTCSGSGAGTNTGTTSSAPGTTTTTNAPATNSSARNLQTTTTTTTTTTTNTAADNRNILACSPGQDARLQGEKMFWQQTDSNGQTIDYLSRSYSIKTTDMVSILAMQKGNTFQSWTSPYDDDYYLYEVVDGNLTVTQMLQDLEAENVGLTWFLRFFTFILCVGGLVLITTPLTVLPDIVPCVGPWIGDLVGYVLYAFDCALGCCCWCFVTAIAWITYRPMVAIPLLCVSCCMCVGGGFLAYKNHQVKQIRLNAEAEMAKNKQEGGGEEDVEVAGEYQPEKFGEE